MQMKRWIAVLTAALFCLFCTGCVQKTAQTVKDAAEGRTYIATNFALYDFARVMAREQDTVVMLLSPGAESHDYEVTLADVAQIEKCDLFLYGGGEDERWVYDVLDALAAQGETVPVFCALAHVPLLPESAALEADGHSHDHAYGEDEHDHDHAHGEDEHDHDHAHDEDEHAKTTVPAAGSRHAFDGMDAHIWTSPARDIALLEALAETIRTTVGVEPADCTPYIERLRETDDAMRAAVAGMPEERRVLLVADRFPFLYMASDYGIDWHAAFAGCASDTEPSLATLYALIRLTRETGASTIWTIELSDGKCAAVVAGETGARIDVLQSCQNVTRAQFDAGVTVADLLAENAAKLSSLWQGGRAAAAQ